MAYFGTNGVRGKYDQLYPKLALRLSQAIGAYFGRGKIIVARDCRLTGDALRAGVVAGLADVGCEVIDIGIASSPTAEFMIKKLKADGCIIISASHNPPEWNALKVVDGEGVSVSRERGLEIEKLIDKVKPASWDKVGKINNYEGAAGEHIEAIMSLLDAKKIKNKKPKIVLDCGNGTAALVAPKLFMELGCEVLAMNAQMDGRFPGRPSEPTEENVKELMAAVKASGADAGVAWDGDGDRVIFVDEKGNYVIGDRVYALCVMWKLQKNKKTGEKGERAEIVTTVATSKAVEDVAAKYGAKTRYTAIGAPRLCEDMLRKPAVLGGEEVGGVIWPELSLAKDGFLTAAKMAEAVAERPLSEWLKGVPRYYNVKRKIAAYEAGKKKIVSRVLEYAKKNKLNHTDVDGVRVNFKDSWVIVRASGTEDYVRLFAEARSESEAKKLADEYEQIAKG